MLELHRLTADGPLDHQLHVRLPRHACVERVEPPTLATARQARVALAVSLAAARSLANQGRIENVG